MVAGVLVEEDGAGVVAVASTLGGDVSVIQEPRIDVTASREFQAGPLSSLLPGCGMATAPKFADDWTSFVSPVALAIYTSPKQTTPNFLICGSGFGSNRWP